MKAVLNWILSLLGFALLIGLMVISIVDVTTLIDPNWMGFINFLRQYGAIIIVGALVFVNIVGKGIIRIILTIVFLLVAAFYIFTTVFPAQFVHLFGIA